MNEEVVMPFLCTFFICFTCRQCISRIIRTDKRKIDQRFEQISQKYNIGDELSKEDAKFVKKYANPVEKPVESQKSKSFNKTGYTPGKKIGGNIKGNVTSNIGVLKNSWGTNFLAKKVKGKTTKITASATHTAYGLIGSGGVGLVHKKTFKKLAKRHGVDFKSQKNTWRPSQFLYYG